MESKWSPKWTPLGNLLLPGSGGRRPIRIWGSVSCALGGPGHQASDPALRFVSLLQAALAGGHGHVANRLGKPPKSPAIWGWRRKSAGRAWTPQGTRIGWIAGSDLFLDPALSYQVAQQAAGTERLLLSEQSLRHRLRESGLLASVDAGRQMLLVRRT